MGNGHGEASVLLIKPSTTDADTPEEAGHRNSFEITATRTAQFADKSQHAIVFTVKT
jgi:hypothetical protein